MDISTLKCPDCEQDIHVDDGLYLTPGSVDADHAAGSHSEPLTSNLAPEGVIVPTISADSRARRIRKT
jgi:hypothetical protein